MLLGEVRQHDIVISMGDYNFTQNSPYYEQITSHLVDSWLARWPDGVGQVDMEHVAPVDAGERKTSSGKLLGEGRLDMTDRIDHIFVSDNFKVKESHYLPAPESQTDHPAHWAVVSWE